ncbi:MAG: HAMP domain-containing protein [Steroidobacteraceae bacterium]|nr:HAMP domain-containing protein [Steroidobacteraceae bacterium]
MLERLRQLLRARRTRSVADDTAPRAREFLRRIAGDLSNPLARLRFDPRKAGLAWLLAGINVALVVLVMTGISFIAVGMLRDLADEQGQARVQLAGAVAREDLRRMGEDALSAARILADRPTLQRLLAQGNVESIPPFLRRFCETAGMDACGVFEGDKLVAEAGASVPWSDIVTANAEQGERFLVTPESSKYPMLGAVTRVSNPPDVRVFIVRLMDEKLARALSAHVGLDVRLINYRAFSAAPVNDFTSLHSAGLADGRSAVQRVPALDLYASSFPVFASTGEVIALIETRLPAAAIDTSTGRLIRRLILAAIVLSVLAVIAGIILGQLVAAPIEALTDSAVRLGQGDFSTSIPTRGPAEVGALARTMEDMRHNLVDLTGTLRRHEAEARAVLAGIVEGVYAVDKNRTIRYLNPQAAKLLGVNPEDAVGRFCGDVLNPRWIDGRRPCDFNCPIILARREGSAKNVEHLQTGDRGLRTTVITSSDLAEGLQVQVIRDETELEAVRRARDTVLANISHEFRTPLAAQLASIELLRDGLTTMSTDQQRELVLSLERGTQRLTRLIDNLLESVRIEAGQLSIRRQSVDLGTVIEEARALIESLLTQREQTLEVSIPEDLPPIDGDAQRLTQVFVNLIANANKFAPEGSAIRIGATHADGSVTAWVEDEGTGLPPGAEGSIFERFSRGPEVEPEPGGLGLGLWIVKSIIERHNGRITALRTPEGRMRFSFTLPAGAPGQEFPE